MFTTFHPVLVVQHPGSSSVGGAERGVAVVVGPAALSSQDEDVSKVRTVHHREHCSVGGKFGGQHLPVSVFQDFHLVGQLERD